MPQSPCSLCPRHGPLGHQDAPAPRQACGPLPGVSWGPREALGSGRPFSGSGPPWEVSVVWSGLLSCPTTRVSTRALSESSREAKNRGISVGQGPCLLLGFPGNAGLWPASIPTAAEWAAGVQLRAPTPPPAPLCTVAASPPAPSSPGPGWQRGSDTVWDPAGTGRRGQTVQVPTAGFTSGLAS